MGVQARSAVVRQAFHDQAAYCARLGSPFTAALCEALADTLSMGDAVGRAVLTWAGDPAPAADNVPLRLTGARHALARSGRIRNRAAAYPPHTLPRSLTLAAVLRGVFDEHAAEIVDFLRFTPQTNEVGRSAALIGGLLVVAEQTGLPVDLYEIGASAGLNLLADQYRYRLGGARWGPPKARLVLEPEWTGPPPPVAAPLSIRARRGCDINPIDVRDPVQRERLKSYIWADQADRLERLDAAIDTALAVPFELERADAAEWVVSALPARAQSGAVRVLMHSIVWTYLPHPARARIEQHLAAVGAASSNRAPLAWLRLEFDVKTAESQLRLTLWPSGAEHLLAAAHPHGSWIRWNGLD